MSEPGQLPDIETREDIERLVRAFYTRVLVDPMIGWIFTDVAKLDVEEHVPVITNFWETILLGAGTYRGSAFRPHADVHGKAGGLRAPHFERWLALWGLTIDEHFRGEHATLAKTHARRVATAFFGRLSALPAPHAPAPASERGPVGLPLTLHGQARTA